MDTVRRDLHATTAQCSSLLTRYSKLAAQASTSYSSNGQLRDDLGRKKAELEQELDGALDTVSLSPFISFLILCGEKAEPLSLLEVVRSANREIS